MKPEKHKSTIELIKGKSMVIIYVLVIIISFFKVYPYVFDEKIDLNGDNVQYYLLGKSIAQGDGFSDIKSPEKPPSSRFPPGYPFIIGMTMKVFSPDIVTIKSVNGFFLLASIILLFFLLHLVFKNSHLSFAFSILTLINIHMLKSSIVMMSEMPYLFFSLAALYLLLLVDFNKPIYKNWVFYAMVLMVAFSYHIRSAGLALFGGVALAIVFQKNWKYLLGYVALFLGFCAPWYIRGKLLIQGNSGIYMNVMMYKNPYRRELGKMEFTDWFTRLFKNIERYITHEIPSGCLSFIEVQYNDPVAFSEWVTGILMLTLILFGLWKLKVSRTIMFSYLLGSFGIMFLWPEVWFGIRFIMPVIPILLVLLGYGLYVIIIWLLEKVNVKNSFVVQVVVPLSFLLAIPLFKPSIDALHEKASYGYPPKYQAFFDLAKWTHDNLPDSAVVSSRKPGLFYLFSSRYSHSYARVANREEIIEGFIKSGVDYVVVDELGYSSTPRYLVPAIRSYPMKFKTVKQMGESKTYLFEFRPHLGYWGDKQDDKREGHGTYVWENGNRFEGEWKNNVREGEGTLVLANGNIIKGTWSNDLLNGPIEITSKDGKLLERSIYKDNRRIKVLKR